MRLGVFLLAVALGAAGACSNDTFTNGDGGGDTGTDVGPIGGDGGGPDGFSLDGAVEAAPKRFCESQDAQFCADFDIPNDAGAGFLGSVENGGWTYGFSDKAQAPSPPTAFEVDSADSGSNGGAGLSTLLGNPLDAGASSVATIDLDMKLPSASLPVPMTLFLFGEPVDNGTGTTRFGLMKTGAISYRLTNMAGSNIPLSGSPPATEWTHVTMTIQLSQNGSVKIDVGNGSMTAQINNISTVGPAAPPYIIDVELVAGSQQSVATSVLYDNVVVHYE